MVGGHVRLGEGERVVAFTEGGAGASFVNAGVYAVERRVLEGFPPEVFLDWGKDVFPALLSRGARVSGYPIVGYCLGLDTPARYERGVALIDSGQVRLQ
jgi:NDP-sugar pyrophosphorylase family protein